MKKLPKKYIVVLGAINLDIVTKVPRIPKENETVISEGLKFIPGGKATNAAVTMSRLEGNAILLGKIGDDSFGKEVKKLLNGDGINTDFIDIDSFSPTGTVIVSVNHKGKNTIIVNENANIRITKDHISDFLRKVDRNLIKVDLFYTTLEPLLEIIEFAITEFNKRNIPIFCDAAPQARPLPENFYRHIDFLSSNEYEMSAMTGINVTDVETAEYAAKQLVKKGANNIIVTLGKLGAIYLKKNSTKSTYFPGNKVKAIDETAAGDAFRGAFVVEYLKTRDLHKSMEFANRAGAFATTKLGTYNAMPTRKELDFLEILK
ncbi:MAG: ribokinase [Candidatus Aenigmarchaeota archaeon]|nr:ribokinase [Candidatus Aenigmarchaeota archaeon]